MVGLSVVFLPGACSSSLLPGFLAPHGGLAAFDGLPAPGHLVPRPAHRVAGACLPAWHRQAKGPRQVVQPGFAQVGVPFPLVGVPLASVDPLFLRGIKPCPRAMLGVLHPSRMRLSRRPGRCLRLARPEGFPASSGDAPARTRRAATSTATDILVVRHQDAASGVSRPGTIACVAWHRAYHVRAGITMAGRFARDRRCCSVPQDSWLPHPPMGGA